MWVYSRRSLTHPGAGDCGAVQDDMYRWEKLGRADLNHNYITDAIVGSLPHGLSLDDRRHVLEKTPASPLVQSLQSVSEVQSLNIPAA